MITSNKIWLTIGFVGQLLFASRFMVQWIYSERHKRSIIPLSFWYLSVLGGITLLTYAIYRKDPIFIMGQTSGTIIYLRNLYFIHRNREYRSVAT